MNRASRAPPAAGRRSGSAASAGTTGRKRPEVLAPLDVAVQPIAHLLRLRRREQAAMPERARAELGRALHPADDPVGGEIVGDPRQQRLVAEFLDQLVVLAGGSREVSRINGRTPERMVGHGAIGILEVDPVGVERGAQRAAGIARRRRHEDAIEPRLGEQPRVRDAVQRHTAAEAQVAQSRLLPQRLGDVDSMSSRTRWTLAAQSAKRRPSAVARSIGAYGRPGRPEQVDELRRVRPRGRRLEVEVLRRRARTRRPASGGSACAPVPSSTAGRRPRGPSPCTRPRSRRSRDTP